MPVNPLLTEILAGLGRPGNAQLAALKLLLLQAVVVILCWPLQDLVDVLNDHDAPLTLTALMITMGITTAYFFARAGAEELLLPGQHGLQYWAQASTSSAGGVLRGYLLGHLVQCLHALVLASPLVLMAFTVSGGEWIPLGWCLLALLVQALFYRMCGALIPLSLGKHPGASRVLVRSLLAVMYLPVGFVFPIASHVALTSHALDEGAFMASVFPSAPDPAEFVMLYGALAMLVSCTLYGLLLRERRRAAHRAGSGLDGAVRS